MSLWVLTLLGPNEEEAVHTRRNPSSPPSPAPTLTVHTLHPGVIPIFTEADVSQVQDSCHQLEDQLLDVGRDPDDLHGILPAQQGQNLYHSTSALPSWVRLLGP